jgi:hypothetical protein
MSRVCRVIIRLLVGALCIAAMVQARAESPVIEWSGHIQKALAGSSGPAKGRIDVLAHVAMFNALNAIDMRYAFYGPALDAAPDAAPEAAVATAAFNVVVALPGARLDDMEKAYAETLKKVTDGAARARGVVVGRIAAQQLLLLRAGDNTERVDATVNPPARGVWERPEYMKRPGNLAMTRVKPMVVVDVATFDPGPPPALDSAVALRDLVEVKALGGRTSARRTVEQALVVGFWASNAEGFDYALLGNLAKARKVSDVEMARMLALLSLSGFDSDIVQVAAKYRYQYWRPNQAIAGPFASADIKDLQWAPLLRTPGSPDWPSGGGIGAGIYETLLPAFAQGAPVTWTVFVSENGMTRSWSDPKAMADELANQRVWAGVHFRSAVEAGRGIGTRVAEYVLANALQPRKSP